MPNLDYRRTADRIYTARRIMLGTAAAAGLLAIGYAIFWLSSD